MKNFKLNIISLAIIIILSLSIFNNSYSQNNSICEDTSDASSGLGIPKRSPATGQFYRVLILYVAFSDDTASTTWNIWPTGGKPINPYTNNGRLIDTSEMTNYTEYTYSKWFQEMSRDSFDFVGDEIYVTLPNPSTYYNEILNLEFGDMNNVVLNRIDSLIDFTRYDNWKFENGHWEWGYDNDVDFVIMNYRNIPDADDWFFNDAGIGGFATLATSATLDGKFIGTGVTALGLLNRLTRTQVIVIHEVCHSFFGHTSLGLMTPGHGGSSYQMSPHEREAIGYIQPNLVNSASGSQTFTLRDYIKYGDCLKIQIPNTSEYFYITNHQKKSKYDGLARGSNTCWVSSRAEQDPYCPVGKGVYIYHRSADNCFNNSWLGYQNGSQYRFYRPMDIENADGKYNWELDRNVSVPELAGTYPIFKTITGDRETGREEYAKYVIDLNFAVILNNIECGGSPDFEITFDDKGDAFDAYNVGYDEIFSPYSNPASNSCENPSTNTGLTFNLQSQDTSGAVVIKIYFNDAEALNELAPSKPKNLKVIAEVVTDNVSFYPKLTWDNNIEPDFTSAYQNPTVPQTRYAVYKSISTSCTGEQSYSFLEEVDTNVYIDSSNLMYVSGSGPGPCSYYQVAASYKVSAIDNTDKESVKSERAVIKGFLDPCGAIGEDNISQNNNNNDLVSFNLYQNFPNPFNPVTTIMYNLPYDNFVRIKVIDILGKEVMTLTDELKSAGRHAVNFDASNLSSGIYYYRIEAGEFTAVRKMLLIK